LTFDPVAAAESSADLTLALLLNPQRASRLVEYHARDAKSPGLEEVLGEVLDGVATRSYSDAAAGMGGAVQHAVDARAVEAALTLAANQQASAAARAITRGKLIALENALQKGDAANQPFASALAARIEEFKHDPAKFVPAKPVEAPPGMPIGAGIDGEDDEVF
jgi:hypothetical protein